ncbi:MAG: hypothetical protein KDC57_12930 [Saprospiraceae bacterium]|nr:hypothetical protein [Saprospiraceae bacterium]
MSPTPIQWEAIDALINATADDDQLAIQWLEDLAKHQHELFGYLVSEENQTVYTETERFQALYLMAIIWKALADQLSDLVLDPETIEAIDAGNWAQYEATVDYAKLLDDWIDESAEPELLELLIQGIVEEDELGEENPEAVWGLFLLTKTCLDALLTLQKHE